MSSKNLSRFYQKFVTISSKTPSKCFRKLFPRNSLPTYGENRPRLNPYIFSKNSFVLLFKSKIYLKFLKHFLHNIYLIIFKKGLKFFFKFSAWISLESHDNFHLKFSNKFAGFFSVRLVPIGSPGLRPSGPLPYSLISIYRGQFTVQSLSKGYDNAQPRLFYLIRIYPG